MSAPRIFDADLIARRLARAHKLGPETFLIERVAGDMAERLQAVLRRFDRAADVSPTADVRGALAAQVGSIAAIAIDHDRLDFGSEPYDLIVSALLLQAVNDLPGALIQIRRALKPDGLFLAALLGGETLTELRQSFAEAEAEIEGGASPRVAPFADLRDLGALLQRAGFALPVADVDRVTVRYADPLKLLLELRRMGATNPLLERRRVPLRRATLARMIEIYGERFVDSDGRVRATFEIVWLSGWAPHESQQKPLRPGSAQQRLADALGVPEQSAGEKTGKP
jgi:SAM-dependent methyltransferase